MTKDPQGPDHNGNACVRKSSAHHSYMQVVLANRRRASINAPGVGMVTHEGYECSFRVVRTVKEKP